MNIWRLANAQFTLLSLIFLNFFFLTNDFEFYRFFFLSAVSSTTFVWMKCYDNVFLVDLLHNIFFCCIFFIHSTPPKCRFGGEKKIHYNNWTIVLYFRLYFSVVVAIAVTTMVFSDYFFMWIHIGTTEHNRDQCELKCLYGMKKRQRWTVVFRISFELRRLANDFNETAKKRFHEMNFEAISFG